MGAGARPFGPARARVVPSGVAALLRGGGVGAWHLPPAGLPHFASGGVLPSRSFFFLSTGGGVLSSLSDVGCGALRFFAFSFLAGVTAGSFSRAEKAVARKRQERP